MRNTRKPRLHGASISAPDEGFASSESLPPLDLAGPGRAKGSLAGRAMAALRFVAGLASVVTVTVGVAWSAQRYAFTSPRFALTKIEVSGGKRFDEQAVRKQAVLSIGDNLFALDIRAVERRLLEDPWIGSVAVSRRLPSTLKVTLTEREARAIALVAGQAYLVSNDGEPFKHVALGDPVDLPVITGLNPEELARDRKRELERVKLALDVLGQYERLSLSRSYVAQEIHIADGGAISLTVGKQGIAILLGKGPFRQRLLMAERVIEETRKAGKLPTVVFADNVAHPERVVARLR